MTLKRRGHFLEDFHAGQVFRHRVGKTITEGLLAAFTDFSMTTNPLSKNVRYARRYGYPGMVAPPGLVMNVVFSQSVEDISENARASLEYRDVRFGAQVSVGDTIEVSTLVLGVEPSRTKPDRGVVHVQTTGRNQHGEAVLTFERKAQIWKRCPQVRVEAERLEEVPRVACELWLPPYDRGAAYGELAHLTNPDTYFEDFHVGDVIEHARGRVIGPEHVLLTAMLDNTAQVHCNQFMVEQSPERFIGGQLLVYGGIPLNIALGLSCPDVGDNSLGDLVYPCGRHLAPVFAGDTVFATTEIRGARELPGRPEVGVVSTTLQGYKLVCSAGPPQKVVVLELEREVVVKRRSHYA